MSRERKPVSAADTLGKDVDGFVRKERKEMELGGRIGLLQATVHPSRRW